MKKIKYLILFLFLIIPINLNAAEKTVISKNGKYNADLYTKANMVINDQPIYFDFYWEPLEQEDRTVDEWEEFVKSTAGAKACDKDSEPEVVPVEEEMCYAWNAQINITVNLTKKLIFTINPDDPESVPTSVSCRYMIENTYFKNGIGSCDDPDLTEKIDQKYLESKAIDCLDQKIEKYKTIYGLQGSSSNPTCTSSKVYLPLSQKDSCDLKSLLVNQPGVVKYALKCNPVGESVKKERQLTGNMYKDSDGNDAYCIQPGKKYKNSQTYYVDKTYDISTCKSSSDSFGCGLASILNAGIEKKYDYATILTALRLWTAYETADDGWWERLDNGKTLSTTEKIFASTATAAMSGYQGTEYNDGYPGDDRVLYAKSGAGTLSSAIELFKKCASGSLEAVSGGLHSDKSIVDFTNGSDTINITTPSKVTSVSTSNSKVKAAIGSSRESNGTFITEIILTASDPDCKIGEFNLSVEAEGAIGGMKRYRPSSPTYQTMFIYDKNSKDSSITLSTTCGTKGNCPTELKVSTDVSENCEAGGNEALFTDPTLDEILDPCRDSGEELVKREKYNTTAKDMTIGYSNSYCKLYCREETHITFMDEVWKTTDGEDIVAGRHFDYDLPGKVASAKVSTFVEGKKECESVIEYDKWEAAFKTAQENVLKTWSSMKYWEALKDNPQANPQNKTETISDFPKCCSQPADFLSCISKVGGTTENCCEKGGYKNGISESCTITVYKWGSAEYTKCTTGGCSTESTGVVTNGKVKGSCDTCSGNCTCEGTVYQDSGDPSLYAQRQYLGAVELYKSARNYREQLYIDIQNCNLYNSKDWGANSITIIDKEAFVNSDSVKNTIKENYPGSYTGSIDDEDVVYQDEDYGDSVVIGSAVDAVSTFNGEAISSSTNFCKDCTKTAEMGANTTKKIEYHLCSETGNECKTIKVDVPINTRALIETGMEADYYQDQNYSVQAYTGDVAVGGSSEENYEDLQKYIYPIMLSDSTGKYYITVNFEDILKRHEKESIRIDYKGNGIYTCYYNVINKTTKYDDGGLGFIFRPIDLTSVFPWDRKKGENWENAQDVIDEIEDLNNDIWIKDKEYTFTLTPSDRRAIREYNFAKVGLGVGYTDMSLYCEEGNIKCKSYFLDTNNMLQYTSKYDTFNGRDKLK